jgi:anhydro-N-acetylmuramic acid kinase
MNNKLQIFKDNKTKLVIGLLSGTSVDGIDAVLIKISGSGTNTKIKVLDSQTFVIPKKVKEAVLRNSAVKSARIDEICRLNVILGKLFAEAAIKLCRKNNLASEKIDFIGSHGQTIHHIPSTASFLGFKEKSTFQIGDPSVIANLTGITSVGDFRIADCAVGGDGAPLVPYLDFILFRSKLTNRALLNLGGISNITILPKNCYKTGVIAFDTGPGNMLIDGVVHKLFNKHFDKDGRIAAKGKINEKLFNWLKEDLYYKKRPPKSTGREHYGKDFQNKLLRLSKAIDKYDIIRTVTEFTAYSIWYNYDTFLRQKTKISELIISGGGAKNPIICNRLSYYFKGVKIIKLKQSGIDIDNKEAVLFAVLANECLSWNSANMPSVTGAKKNVILGKICLA